jgi:protein involved in polysaccharide export with SLBB domain
VAIARVDLAKRHQQEDILKLELAKTQLESARKAALRQRVVSLLGAVDKPGTYSILDEMQDVVHAIAIAGVKADSFERMRVTVARNDPEGKLQKTEFKMSDLVKPGAKPVPIQDKDVILVEIVGAPAALP